MAIRLADFGTDFRPQTFADLVNPSPTIQSIAGLFASGSVPRVYLISGPFGCGKTTTAEIIARAVLCKSPHADGTPCGECSACKLPLTANTDYQYHNSKGVGVQEARDIVSSVSFKPRTSARRVVVLDEAHALNTHAQSQLLIPVETPPGDYIVWIFCTNQPSGLRPELISRCVHGRVDLPSLEDVVRLLAKVAQQQQLIVSEGILGDIARASGCHYRDALHLLQVGSAAGGLQTTADVERAATTSPYSVALSVFGSAIHGDTGAALRAAAVTDDPRTVLKMVGSFASRLAVYSLSGIGVPDWERVNFERFVDGLVRAAWSGVLLQMLPATEQVLASLQTFAVDADVVLNNFIIQWSLNFRAAHAAHSG